MSTDNTTTSPWIIQLRTYDDDSGNDVTTDSSGNIYMTETTYGGLDRKTTSCNHDIVLVKYASSGSKQ